MTTTGRSAAEADRHNETTTGTRARVAVTATIARTEETQVYGEVVEGLVTPAVVLDHAGLVVSANCVSCHTAHSVLPAWDPKSSVQCWR